MKKVLVTGGSRGIGFAIVEKFKIEGYYVEAPSRSELNLLNDQSIEEYFSKKSNREFDIIINNAGINELGCIEEVTDENIKATMQINVIAPMKLIRAIVPYMKNNTFGRIINIASIWGIVSKEKRITYSVSKNAIHGITNTLAVELAPNNILVNTVCPGFTETELTFKNNNAEQVQDICKDIPFGRMAKPSEIADLVFYLASPSNTYITGQRIAVDGGFTSK